MGQTSTYLVHHRAIMMHSFAYVRQNSEPSGKLTIILPPWKLSAQPLHIRGHWGNQLVQYFCIKRRSRRLFYLDVTNEIKSFPFLLQIGLCFRSMLKINSHIVSVQIPCEKSLISKNAFMTMKYKYRVSNFPMKFTDREIANFPIGNLGKLKLSDLISKLLFHSLFLFEIGKFH